MNRFVRWVALLLVFVTPAWAGYSRSSSSSSSSRSSSSSSRSSWSGSSSRSSGSSGFSRPSTSYSRPSSPPSSSSGFSRPTTGFSRPGITMSSVPRNTNTGLSRSSSTAKPAMSSTDMALRSKTNIAGASSFKTRADARAAFTRQYSSTYTSHYDREPSVRPRWVPFHYAYYGHPVNVIYNPYYHDYGYWYNGTWLAYNALADAAMVDSLMSQQNYYQPQQQAPMYPSSNHSDPLTYVIIGIIVVAGISAAVFIATRR